MNDIQNKYMVQLKELTQQKRKLQDEIRENEEEYLDELAKLKRNKT